MRYSITILVGLALLAEGCAFIGRPATPVSGLQRRAITSRDLGKELNADYQDLWWATITVLQDAGFVLRDADQQAGFIYGAWLNRYEVTNVTQSPLAETIASGVGASFLDDFLAATSSTSTAPGELDEDGNWVEFTDIEVSVTFERRARNGIRVRISSRFGWDGSPQDSDEFASRFFGAIRKEVFLRRATAAAE